MAADALSRKSEDEAGLEQGGCLTLICRSVSVVLEKLRKENLKDAELTALHQQYQSIQLSSEYSVNDDILLFRQRYYISKNSPLKGLLLEEFHSSLAAGHVGVKRTLVRLASNFYWKGMQRDVEEFVASCLICQQIKSSTQPPAGFLQPLPIPSVVWDELTMDFIIGLPESRGYTVILVVVDRLTKSAHFGALPTQFTAYKTAELFTDIVVKLHGFPSTIISDRDPIFLSAFWKCLFELSGTKLRHSSAYHPQTDGQTEVVNRGLEQYLRAFTQDRPTDWVKLLSWAEFSYNSNYHSGLKMSPYQALFGRRPPTIPPYRHSTTPNQAADELLRTRDELLRELRKNLLHAQQRMVQKANAHRRDFQFAKGDQVMVRLQPHRQSSVAQRPFRKLAKRYYGPFRVLDRIGRVAYKIDLPPSSKIHPVFHVSKLKLYKGNDNIRVQDLPRNSLNNHPILSPLAICAKRTTIHRGREVPQVLVQWEGLHPEESSWEDAEELAKSFPNLCLEDKAVFQAGGDDTAQQASREDDIVILAQNEAAQVKARRGPARERKQPVRFRDYTL